MVDAHQPRLDKLRRYQYVLDQAFRVPGTNLRFGWDPIIGLVPWAGDFLTALMAAAIVVQSHRMGVPKVVQARMVINVALDLLIGVVPFLGDVADVFWKANTKNMALLERHAHAQRPPTTGDWLFVGGVIGVIALLAMIPGLLILWVGSSILEWASTR